MKRTPSRRAVLLAALLSCLLLPAVFLAQSAGPKALVVCPPTDTQGCDRVAAQLALTMNGGTPVFPGGVDKRYTELRTMPYSQLQSYAVVFVPSLANAPYDLLREDAVKVRLQQVLRGRVAVWSGTPDRGTTSGASAGKLTLIENLARWAAAQHAADGTTGLVVLQDFSDNRPDGTSPRYDWVQGIAGVVIQPDLEAKTYRQVERNTANPAAEPIVGSLAYDNMASFGVQLPQPVMVVGGWGQTTQGKKATRGQIVLGTANRSPAACQVAGTSGGTFSFQSGNVVLNFPAGALSQDWCLSVSPANATASGYVANTAYSFGPASLSFPHTPPATATIRYAESDIPGGASESNLAIFGFRAGSWTEVPGSSVDAVNNTVTAPIDHFSQYAVFVKGTTDGGGGGGGGGKGGAPTAANDAYSVDEDNALNVAAPGVLANDTDPQGDPLTAAVVSGPSHGALTLNANGSFTYTPNANFNGTDSFTYKANDGRRDSNVATVTITVNPVNDAPTAVDDAYSTDEDVALNVAAPGVLANDTDPEGNTLSAVLVSGPANGTLTLNANGSFTYTPSAGFSGTDQFTYRANDGTADSNAATVTITVNDVNDAPVAVNDAYATDEDAPLNVAAPGVLANDTDSESNPLTAVLASGPANGTLTLNANGSFTYTPSAGFSGTDQFTYKANEGTSDSNVATVTITVNDVNDAPVAVNDAYSTDEDVALNVAAPGVLANDTDPEGNTLSAVLVSGPANGTLTLNANGSFTYTPTADFNGTDQFTYKANDGTSDSNVATVTITVNAVAEPPVAVNDAYSVDEDNTLNVAAPGVLGNDTDPESDPLTAVLVSTTTNGTLTLNADGSFGYTPAPGFSGTDQFTYKANDGTSDSNVATVTITVNAVNDAPVAVDDAYSTDEDVALNVAAPGVLANDTDEEGNTLRAVLVSGPANGTLTLNANGSFTYTPAANYFGTDQFTYKANDGSGDSNTVSVTITVNPVNDAPTAGPDAYGAIGNVVISVAAGAGVLANDTDVEGSALSAVAGTIASTNGGTVEMRADGSFTYVSAAGFNGSDSFTYSVTDGELSSAGTVTMTVTGRYWFVDASAAPGGDGRQHRKLQSLTPLNGAGGAGDPDQASDVILVHSGTYSSAIALESGQHLVGQGIPSDLTATVNGQTVTLLAAGSAPTIGAASGNAITLSSGNTLRGFVAGSAPGAAISGSAVGTLTVSDVSIDNGSGRALDLTTSGTLSAAFGSISATGGTGNGINLVGQTGTLTSGSTSITNPSGTGIHVQGSGGFNFGGTTVSKSSTSGTGVHLQSNSGTTTFSSLALTTSNGTGLAASSAGTVNVTTGSIGATGGPAIDLGSTTAGMTFTSVASTNSTGAGVSLATVGGSLTSGTTSVQNPTGAGISISGSSAAVNLGNTTSNSSGATGVSLSTNTGALTFGALNVSPDASQRALHATNNSGTITASSGAVSASNAVAVEITRASGTTPLAVSLTSVSANGGSSGIVLSNTSGSFAVTGSGTAGSGGTIQNTVGGDGTTAGIGVYLNNASNVSLNRMQINDHQGFGIRGSGVSGFTMQNSVISGANGTNGANPFLESSIFFTELTGTATFTSVAVSGGRLDNLRVKNTTGTLNFSFSGTGCAIRNNSTSADGNMGLAILPEGNAVIHASVSGCTFQGNRTIALRGDAAGSSQLTFDATNNTIVAGTGGNNQGNQGIEVSTSADAQVSFDLNGNRVGTDGATAQPLLNTGINVFGGNRSTLTGKVRGNTVRNNTSVAAGTSNGFGIRVFANDTANIRANVNANTVSGVSTDYGILVEASGADTQVPPSGTGRVDVAVTNNNASVLSGALDAIRVQARHNNRVCSRITGNTTGTGGSGFFGLFVRQVNAATFLIEGLTGGATTYLQSQNPAAASVGDNGGTFTATAANSCNIPAL
ncbi:MAG TPA: Ig-like domain-containing protein [Longimicrobiaceae bacterium]|nr:Ig-like domain-containing protein [Longimicrobiaceae bacterium]